MTTSYRPAQYLRQNLDHLLLQTTNDRGEVSPGLEYALALAGPKARAVRLPTEVLAAYSFGHATGILIINRETRIVWCSAGPLQLVAALAQQYRATHALNWDGAIELDLHEDTPAISEHRPNPVPSTGIHSFPKLPSLHAASNRKSSSSPKAWLAC